MANIVLISGLAGSGKTYVADKIKESLKDMFEVKYFGATKDNYQEFIKVHAKEDILLILEMHPPFDKIDLKDHNLLHIVISKDWELYNTDLSKEKKKFIDDFFDKNPKRERWNRDIIKYNKTRFAHIKHATVAGDFKIAKSCEMASQKILDFVDETRHKELFLFVNENYDYMLYHSPVVYGKTLYEGTAPTMNKFMSLKLDEFLGTDKKENTCLDIGCNIGAVTQLLNQLHFKQVIGIDLLLENIDCATWMHKKFYRNAKTRFYKRDFMEENDNYDYTFALAVLHHVAKKHKFEDVVKHLGEITNIGSVIEINEMPGWPLIKIVAELREHFNEIKVIGNAYLPVQKTLAKNRWIIHCLK